jgi:hypothetical protein
MRKIRPPQAVVIKAFTEMFLHVVTMRIIRMIDVAKTTVFSCVIRSIDLFFQSLSLLGEQNRGRKVWLILARRPPRFAGKTISTSKIGNSRVTGRSKFYTYISYDKWSLA